MEYCPVLISIFRNITALDDQYGHEVTGLFAALLFDAVLHDPLRKPASFSDWWIERVITWSNEWTTNENAPNMAIIKTYVNQTNLLGQSLRGRTETE